MAHRSTMNFSEAVEIATASLWAHKLRIVLTLLGGGSGCWRGRGWGFR